MTINVISCFQIDLKQKMSEYNPRIDISSLLYPFIDQCILGFSNGIMYLLFSPSGLSFCTTKYTAYQTHSSGKMTYLDRHPMSCGGANTVMTMFHLQRSSDNMRYQYKCCTFQANVCNLQIKYTSFSDNGNGNTIYLDRHTADCSATGFINYLKVENDSGNENVRYKYYCANLVAKWQPKASCYSATTSYSDDGDGKVYFLDRQTVSCDSGYALSYVKLQRKSSTKQWRYLYRCCKVTY